MVVHYNAEVSVEAEESIEHSRERGLRRKKGLHVDFLRKGKSSMVWASRTTNRMKGNIIPRVCDDLFLVLETDKQMAILDKSYDIRDPTIY